METTRKIAQIIEGQATSDGAGVKLKRILGTAELNQLDPFLLLDEFKNENADDYMGGFPDHPHRGFETVTYMLAGAFTHRDSRGNEGHLTSGSVQWMTAGRGIIHSEMPESTDGLVWGFQLWLNLPAKLKMIKPRYQDISPDKIPTAEKDGIKVKVIAGEYQGLKGPAQAKYPASYFDVEIQPGAVFSQSAPADQNTFIYVFGGKVKAGPQNDSALVPSSHLGVFGEGGQVRVESAGGQPARFLFASAQKLGEPVARGGPFVMNTQGELKKAFLDYQTGNFG
jgi:redox-sensitive bicupin YhaK (pirin superfamily)